jgi:lipopolysaccharide transport system ATP-binding protein
MKPAICTESLCKQYFLGTGQESGYRTLREAIVRTVHAPWARLRRLAAPAAPAERGDRPDSIWALKDVSFEIQPGEVVGIIGRNGAGKSTLLKILSRITEPTHGRVEFRGRLGSLLEVGTGFHPELTGRENIYMNGSILGMSRQEINRKFDEIVSFAEMSQFLDTPVKRYSSGMYVRLAFAVAAHLDLEILLVDEVLAVGDLEFQKKCLQKMGDIATGGRTVLFVSHNMAIIHRLCERCLVLRQGRVQTFAPTEEAIQSYLAEAVAHSGVWQRHPSIPSGHEVQVQSVRILNEEGNPTGIIACQSPFDIAVEYQALRDLPPFEIAIQIKNAQGMPIFSSLDSDTAEWPGRSRPAGKYRSLCRIPGHLLAPGSYSLTFGALIINQQVFDFHWDALSFEVSSVGCITTKRNHRRLGVIVPILDWQIRSID